MKKHSVEQTAAWAKEYGIRGYEHLDPQHRERHRQISLKRANEKPYEGRNHYQGKKRGDQNFRRR